MPCGFALRVSPTVKARWEPSTGACEPDLAPQRQSWLSPIILHGWSTACCATDKTMSKKAFTSTNSNSDSNASNGSKKKLAHLICNSLPLSSFHHQFLERTGKQQPRRLSDLGLFKKHDALKCP